MAFTTLAAPLVPGSIFGGTVDGSGATFLESTPASGGNTAIVYTYQRSPAGTNTWTDTTLTDSQGEITGLTAATSYDIRRRAVAGAETVFSNIVTILTDSATGNTGGGSGVNGTYRSDVHFTLNNYAPGRVRADFALNVYEYVGNIQTNIPFNVLYFRENPQEPGRYDFGLQLLVTPNGNEFVACALSVDVPNTQQVYEILPFLAIAFSVNQGTGGGTVGNTAATLTPSQVHELLNQQIVVIGGTGQTRRVDVHSGTVGFIVGAVDFGTKQVSEQQGSGSYDYVLTDDTWIIALQTGTRVSISAPI